MGFLNDTFKRKILFIFKKYFPQINPKIVFINKLSIGSFFNSKDPISLEFRSDNVYLFKCPSCTGASYIGSTVRSLGARFSAHMGISWRTSKILNRKEKSSIREHTISCKTNISIENFKVLAFNNNKHCLRTLESLYIKHYKPTLNEDLGAISLLIN